MSIQNVRLWESSDFCCPRKRQSWVLAALVPSSSPLSFWTPRGRLDQSQLERHRRKRLEPTWVWGPVLGCVTLSQLSPSRDLQRDVGSFRAELPQVQGSGKPGSATKVLVPPATTLSAFHPGSQYIAQITRHEASFHAALGEDGVGVKPSSGGRWGGSVIRTQKLTCP